MSIDTRIVSISLLFFLSFSLSSAWGVSESALKADRIAPPLTELLNAFTPSPDAEAQVLQRTTRVVVSQDAPVRTRSYIAVYINSAAAVRDYSQMSISFNSHFEDVKLEFARVRTADGQMQNVRPSAVQVQSPSSENFYHDSKELLFSLPNVQPGSVIEFQYLRTDTQAIVPGHWFGGYSLHWWEERAAGQGARMDPVHRADVEVYAPTALSLQSRLSSDHKVSHSRRVERGQQVLRWHVERLPEIMLQDRMPRGEEVAALVQLTTLSSWQDVVIWADRLFEPHITSSRELDSLVKTLAAQADTPEGRVKAVYQTLQERVRYVFAHVGRGGYEPHSAPEVWSNGYGDCKDQTILAVTLLRKLGVTAYPALIATRAMGKQNMELPRVTFDHMLVYLPAQEGLAETWLDTSGDKRLYPGHSVALEGQPALIINPQQRQSSSGVTILPTRGPQYHYADVAVDFGQVSVKQVEASVQVTFGGLFEEHFRSLWQFNPERDKTFRELVNHLYSTAHVLSVDGENADNLFEPFHVKARLRFDDAWEGDESPLQYGFSYSALLGLFTDMHQLYEPKDRKQAYAIDPGFALRSQLSFTRPSESHVSNLLTRGDAIQNDFFSFEQTGQETEQGYVIRQNLVLKQQDISVEHFPAYHAKVRELLGGHDWVVRFEYDKSAARRLALQKQIAEMDGAAEQIAIARHHIRYGDFVKALDAARQAVDLAPQNGEAHYILGLSQGYQNLLNKSDRSFQRAKDLGYRP